MAELSIRAVIHRDRPWITARVSDAFASPRVVSRGRLHDCRHLDGFIAEFNQQPAGVCLTNIHGDEMEVVVLIATLRGAGIAGALLDKVKARAQAIRMQRLWLITTNNNSAAIRFYERSGFILTAIHEHAVTEARLLKPEIPSHDETGVPIQDEWEYEVSPWPVKHG